MSVDSLVDSIGGDPQYIKFLLVERPYIREALVRTTAILDDEARTLAYSDNVGNALHNDLIELEEWLSGLSPQDRKALLDWAAEQERIPVYGSASIKVHKAGRRRVARLLRQYGEHTHVQAQPKGPGAPLPVRKDERGEQGSAA